MLSLTYFLLPPNNQYHKGWIYHSIKLFVSCFREFADPVVAEAMLEFLIINQKRLLTAFPNLMPQV